MSVEVRVFAVETEERTLYCFANADAAVAHCEALDVEAAVWLFWDERGRPLEPQFIEPNRRGLFVVRNGTYVLQECSELHHATLMEALDEMVSIEANPWFDSFDKVREALAHE